MGNQVAGSMKPPEILGEVERVPKEPWLSSSGDGPAEEEKRLGHSQSLASGDLVEQGQAENSKVSNRNCFLTCLCARGGSRDKYPEE